MSDPVGFRWLVQMAEAARGRLYVLLCKDRVSEFTIEVHLVEGEEPIGPYPIRLQPEDVGNWPTESRPVATLTKAGVFCTISRLNAMAVGERLLMSLEWGEAPCAPSYFFLDLNTKAWSEVQITAPTLAPQGQTTGVSPP